MRRVYTAPYYLSMSKLDDDALQEFVRLARNADLAKVLWMLGTEEWRSRKVGAWFSIVRPEPEVDDALRESLLTSRGRLTAPELAIACALRFGAEALPLIHEYQKIGRRDDHGDLSETSAVIIQLGGTPLWDLPSERNALWMAQQWSLGVRISQLPRYQD